MQDDLRLSGWTDGVFDGGNSFAAMATALVLDGRSSRTIQNA